MLNKIVLQGRLCSDPELRHTQSGAAVSSFTLAVDRDFKSHSGERETDFVKCTAWKSVAEFTARYLSRGRMAVVVGSLQIRAWEDKDGNKRRTAEVIAESVYFGDSKRDPLDKLAKDAAPVSEPSFEDVEDDQEGLPF